MIERGGGFGFADETLQPLGVLSELTLQQLKRDRAFEYCVTRQKDFTHPAGADLREDLIVAQFLPDLYSERRSEVIRRKVFSFELKRGSGQKLTGLLIRTQQHFNLATKAIIVSASLRQKSRTPIRRLLQRGVVKLLDALPAFDVHKTRVVIRPAVYDIASSL
jgi:hypothetical protein